MVATGRKEREVQVASFCCMRALVLVLMLVLVLVWLLARVLLLALIFVYS